MSGFAALVYCLMFIIVCMIVATVAVFAGWYWASSMAVGMIGGLLLSVAIRLLTGE